MFYSFSEAISVPILLTLLISYSSFFLGNLNSRDKDGVPELVSVGHKDLTWTCIDLTPNHCTGAEQLAYMFSEACYSVLI